MRARCFTRCKQDSFGKMLYKIPLERCCTRFLLKGVLQGASKIPEERCFTRCKQDSGGKVFYKMQARFRRKGVSQGASQEKKNLTIWWKFVETNVWRWNEKTICREMRGVYFAKWNLNNINIASPLRLEFVEEVELLLRLFFFGWVFHKRANQSL